MGSWRHCGREMGWVALVVRQTWKEEGPRLIHLEARWTAGRIQCANSATQTFTPYGPYISHHHWRPFTRMNKKTCFDLLTYTKATGISRLRFDDLIQRALVTPSYQCPRPRLTPPHLRPLLTPPIFAPSSSSTQPPSRYTSPIDTYTTKKPIPKHLLTTHHVQPSRPPKPRNPPPTPPRPGPLDPHQRRLLRRPHPLPALHPRHDGPRPQPRSRRHRHLCGYLPPTPPPPLPTQNIP